MKSLSLFLLILVVSFGLIHQVSVAQESDVQKARMLISFEVFSPSLVKFSEYFNNFMIQWWDANRGRMATGNWAINVVQIGASHENWIPFVVWIYKPNTNRSSPVPSYYFLFVLSRKISDKEIMAAASAVKVKAVECLNVLTREVFEERAF